MADICLVFKWSGCRSSNGIQKLDYLTSKQVPTIQNWDLPCFQIATVDRFGYKRKYFLVDGWDPELV